MASMLMSCLTKWRLRCPQDSTLSSGWTALVVVVTPELDVVVVAGVEVVVVGLDVVVPVVDVVVGSGVVDVVVVVVDPDVVVVVVDPDVVVVVVDPDVATAMTGDVLRCGRCPADDAGGRAVVRIGGTGQIRLLPETTRTREIAGSTVRVMLPPEAVNGPTVTGVAGSGSNSPVDGTGDGIGASIEIGGAATVAGVAPVASTLSAAVPVIAEFPNAAAAPTIEAGSATVV